MPFDHDCVCTTHYTTLIAPFLSNRLGNSRSKVSDRGRLSRRKSVRKRGADGQCCPNCSRLAAFAPGPSGRDLSFAILVVRPAMFAQRTAQIGTNSSPSGRIRRAIWAHNLLRDGGTSCRDSAFDALSNAPNTSANEPQYATLLLHRPLLTHRTRAHKSHKYPKQNILIIYSKSVSTHHIGV